jgi:hypothetical protein
LRKRGKRERGERGKRDRRGDGERFMFLHKLVILFPSILTYFSGV